MLDVRADAAGLVEPPVACGQVQHAVQAAEPVERIGGVRCLFPQPLDPDEDMVAVGRAARLSLAVEADALQVVV